MTEISINRSNCTSEQYDTHLLHDEALRYHKHKYTSQHIFHNG